MEPEYPTTASKSGLRSSSRPRSKPKEFWRETPAPGKVPFSHFFSDLPHLALPRKLSGTLVAPCFHAVGVHA